MTVLALEFSSDRRSVALVREGVVLADAVHQVTRTTPVFALIADVLARAGVAREAVECVAVGIGPGSYTGVRLAISVAQGWRLASGVKVAGVNSFDTLALAEAAAGLGRVLLAVDAQRQEFAVAFAEEGRLVSPIHLASMAELKSQLAQGAVVAGPEVQRLLGGGVELFPSAAIAAQLAESRAMFVPAETLAPVYLREAAFVKAPPPRVV
ncbi:MAG TPA: tRNA (adenosine(37)-N6)-threonylcarbamoyltransferase complex dimerization subunit type 1 TsaB [Candidatus Limnocylindria bacterium]|jgi:tRNA threonylcarbamoyladenosine biosynthesis protein TsaB|nr:tRNA (adenosine(37)-N6)-threonylcarbamoyltransferase complex dimerization subunit type 1 TsaB [Candidatus Limnocylindria bacterium]